MICKSPVFIAAVSLDAISEGLGNIKQNSDRSFATMQKTHPVTVHEGISEGWLPAGTEYKVITIGRALGRPYDVDSVGPEVRKKIEEAGFRLGNHAELVALSSADSQLFRNKSVWALGTRREDRPGCGCTVGIAFAAEAGTGQFISNCYACFFNEKAYVLIIKN